MTVKKLHVLLVATICAAALLANGLIVLALASTADTLVVENTNDNGQGSLRQAITDAKNGDVITFDLPQDSTILLTSGPLVIENNISIIGPEPQTARQIAAEGDNTITIDGGNNDRIFQMDLQNFSLENLNLTGGNAASSAVAPGLGGAIYIAGGEFSGNFLFFVDNQAPTGGGAIYNNGGTVELSDTVLQFNKTTNEQSLGGAIVNAGVPGFPAGMTLNNIWLDRNTSGLVGGGLSNFAQGAASSVMATNLICTRNEATEGGCANNAATSAPASNASMIIDGANIINNMAETGGGLQNAAGTLNAYDTYFVDNAVEKTGSAVASGGETVILNSFIISATIPITADGSTIFKVPNAPAVKLFGSVISNDANCADDNDIDNMGYNLSNSDDCFANGQNNSQVQANLSSWLTFARRQQQGSSDPVEIVPYFNIDDYDNFIPSSDIPPVSQLGEDYHGVVRPQGEGASPGPLESAGEIVVTKVVQGGEAMPGSSYAVALYEENAFQFSTGPLPAIHEAAVQNGGSHRFRLTSRAAASGKVPVTLVEKSTVLGQYDVSISCDNGAASASNEIKMEAGLLEKINCTILNIRKTDLKIYLPIVMKQ